MKLVWEKFRKNVDGKTCVTGRDRVLLSVSGGPDSMCMLGLFARLARVRRGLELAVVYVDHGLRPAEAVKEKMFVREAGRKLGIPVEVRKAGSLRKMKKAGTEAAARKARYAVLEKVAAERGCSMIATGHNLNDQVETVMLNLLRSTGEDGIAGIPYVRKLPSGIPVIRPLLSIRRYEIMSYLKQRGIRYRIDSSNRKLVFTRNRLRRKVLPLLEDINPGVYEHIGNLAEWNMLRDRYVGGAVRTAAGKITNKCGRNSFKLEINRFIKYNEYLRYKLINYLLISLSGSKRGLYSKFSREITEFASGRGTMIKAGPFECRRRKKYFVISRTGNR